MNPLQALTQTIAYLKTEIKKETDPVRVRRLQEKLQDAETELTLLEK